MILGELLKFVEVFAVAVVPMKVAEEEEDNNKKTFEFVTVIVVVDCNVSFKGFKADDPDDCGLVLLGIVVAGS